MKLKITIDMDNAAFEPCNGRESARILERLAEIIRGMHFPAPETFPPLRDENGNAVGTVKVTN